MAAPRALAPAGAGAAAQSPGCRRGCPGRRRRRALRRADPAAGEAAASAARGLPRAGDAALLSSPDGRTRDTLAGGGDGSGPEGESGQRGVRLSFSTQRNYLSFLHVASVNNSSVLSTMGGLPQCFQNHHGFIHSPADGHSGWSAISGWREHSRTNLLSNAFLSCGLIPSGRTDGSYFREMCSSL